MEYQENEKAYVANVLMKKKQRFAFIVNGIKSISKQYSIINVLIAIFYYKFLVEIRKLCQCL